MAQPSTPRRVHDSRPARVAVAVGLTVLLAGCAIGASSIAPTASIHPPASPAAAALTGSGGVPAGTPTTVPGGDALLLPEATLRGVGGPPGPAAGALGSFTWDHAGTDAPWLVPPAAVSVAAGRRLAVTFPRADLTARRWIARWAPVRDSVPGDVGWTAEGDGPAAFSAPASGGTWSLQVDARFGPGRQATWYWRVEVVP